MDCGDCELRMPAETENRISLSLSLSRFSCLSNIFLPIFFVFQLFIFISFHSNIISFLPNVSFRNSFLTFNSTKIYHFQTFPYRVILFHNLSSYPNTSSSLHSIAATFFMSQLFLISSFHSTNILHVPNLPHRFITFHHPSSCPNPSF